MFKAGHGLAETILTDTVLARKLQLAVNEIQIITANLSSASQHLDELVSKTETGKGPAAVLLSDSISSQRLKQTLINIEQGTARFNEDMEALKQNFLFRKYFKEQEKKAKSKK